MVQGVCVYVCVGMCVHTYVHTEQQQTMAKLVDLYEGCVGVYCTVLPTFLFI